MDAFIDTLAAFERIHSWWSDETFLKTDNTTLKNFVRDTLHESPYIEELATSGTAESMDALVERLKEDSPKMLLATLVNFLDYLYARDTDRVPFSKELVTWYRVKGWKFPPFSYEKKCE
jgi:hypothetical protein